MSARKAKIRRTAYARECSVRVRGRRAGERGGGWVWICAGVCVCVCVCARPRSAGEGVGRWVWIWLGVFKCLVACEYVRAVGGFRVVVVGGRVWRCLEEL